MRPAQCAKIPSPKLWVIALLAPFLVARYFPYPTLCSTVTTDLVLFEKCPAASLSGHAHLRRGVCLEKTARSLTEEDRSYRLELAVPDSTAFDRVTRKSRCPFVGSKLP